MHPVAGQGFNLGLRDAAALCQLAMGMPAAQLGQADMLARYVKSRNCDRSMGIGLTHALVVGFSNNWPLLPLLRGRGLMAMNMFPFARRALARVMMFGWQ